MTDELLTPGEICSSCAGHGRYQFFQAEDNVETRICSDCKGTGKAQKTRLDRPKLR